MRPLFFVVPDPATDHRSRLAFDILSSFFGEFSQPDLAKCAVNKWTRTFIVPGTCNVSEKSVAWSGCPSYKLLPGTEWFDHIVHMLRRRLSPEQNSGKLEAMKLADLHDAYACPRSVRVKCPATVKTI